MLKRVGHLGLPRRLTGGYDHPDVHLPSGKVYVAHTSNGTVEVVDGEQLNQIKTLPGPPDARGVLCTPELGSVFAAARGVGRILVTVAADDRVVREVHAGFISNSSSSGS